MERCYSRTRGNSIKVFAVDLSAAADVSGCQSFTSGCADGAAVAKTLAVALGLGRTAALHHRLSTSHRIREHIRCLYFGNDNAAGPQVDLADVETLDGAGLALDNYEGLALGPALPDGRRMLLLVNDDNYSQHQIGTQVCASL